MSIAFLGVLLCLTSDFDSPDSQSFSEIDAANPYGIDEHKSCGVRCCLFLDRYLGGTRNFDEILAATPVSPQGTNLRDLATVLGSFGYKVTAKRLGPSSLRGLTNPAIFAVRRAGADHFLVAVKYDPTVDSFLAFDPPRKLTRLSYDSLASQYRGYALIVSSGGHSEPSTWVNGAELRRNSLIASAIIGVLFVLVRKWRGFGKVARASHWLIIAFAATALTSGCHRSEASRAPDRVKLTRITADRNRDIGRIVEGAPLGIEFRVPNTSDIPFDVLDVKKSCTCQTVTLSKSKSILPNEELCVAVKMNSNASVGPFERIVNLVTTSADPSLHEIRLSIRGDVVTLVRAIPSQLSFGEVECGSRHRKRVRIEGFAPAIAHQLKTVSSTVEGLSCAKRTVTGELVDIEVEACFEHHAAGDLFGQINIEFEHPKVKTLSIPVNARVRSRLRAVPAFLQIDGRANIWSGAVCLQSTDGSDFGLESVQAPAGIVAEWKRDRANKHIINVSTNKLTENRATGFQRLLIATDAAGAKDIWIPLIVER